jgi:hypothetical protein
MSMWGKYEIVVRNSEIQLTKEENQKKKIVYYYKSPNILYGHTAGGEDANISSPIHQTESKFHAEDLSKTPKPENVKTKRGLSKLADLAESINQFEDDLNHVS